MKRLLFFSLGMLMAFGATAQQVADLEKTILDVHRETGMQHGTMAVCVYNMTKGR